MSGSKEQASFVIAVINNFTYSNMKPETTTLILGTNCNSSSQPIMVQWSECLPSDQGVEISNLVWLIIFLPMSWKHETWSIWNIGNIKHLKHRKHEAFETINMEPQTSLKLETWNCSCKMKYETCKKWRVIETRNKRQVVKRLHNLNLVNGGWPKFVGSQIYHYLGHVLYLYE